MPQKLLIPERVTELAATAMDELVAPVPNRGVTRGVAELHGLVDERFRDSDATRCLHAGIWLLAGELEKAHVICQAIPTAHGSAWHAVVHRIEGDFWNSKYWWRRAGGIRWSVVAQRLSLELTPLPELTGLTASPYDPATFVDIVEQHHKNSSPELRAALVSVQRLEWLALFEECWIAAAGEASNS